MSSALPGTAQALRGLLNMHDRVAGFPAQHAFFRGVPVRYDGTNPVGIQDHLKSWRDRIFMGGFGCGKTWILDYTLAIMATHQPDNMAVVLRKRFEQLRNTTLATFYNIIEEAGDGKKENLIADVDEKDGAIQVWMRTKGKPSLIIFRVEPDGTDESIRDSLKGYELGCFGLDEATQLKKVSYDTLRTRLRRTGFVLAGLVASNPARDAHWLTKVVQLAERDLERGQRPNELVIRARSYDNPYIRSDYIDELKQQYKDDPAGYDMYVEGKDGMDVAGKPVFRRDFNETVHVDRSLKFDPYMPLYLGLDFGFHHPSAVWFQRDVRERFNVLAQLDPEDLGIDAFADLILDFNRRHFPGAREIQYFGDPAGAQVTDKGDPTIQRLANKGIPVRYMDSDIMPGIECIRQLLQKNIDGRPRLVFHPRCKRLIDAFRGGYYFRERTSGGYGDKPHKDGVYDHPVDALRYGIVNLTLRSSFGMKFPEKAEGLQRIPLK